MSSSGKVKTGYHKIDCRSPTCNKKNIIVPKIQLTCGGKCSRAYCYDMRKVWGKESSEKRKLRDDELIKELLKKKLAKINPKMNVTNGMVIAYKIGLRQGEKKK